jgi:hypothetical protein
LPNSHRHTVSTPCAPIDAPAELRPFAEPSFFLPGEDAGDFEVLRQMMVNDIRPQTNIEWLWTLNIVELSWEILRYRRLKDRVLNAHRAAAIEAILQRLDGEGMPAEAMPMVQIQARRTATEWRNDRQAAGEIEARLRRSGVDNIDINAEVFVQACGLFEMFDQLMQLAQSRRVALLREISIRREFASRVRRVMRVADSL